MHLKEENEKQLDMKINMKKNIFKILFLLHSFAICSQTDPGNPMPDFTKSIKNFVPAAPATAGLLQQADLNYENPLGKVYTGFNLTTLKCKDISLPISVNYDYDGFRPQADAGAIGLGWGLSAGNGVIIKQIGGPKDDFITDALNQGLPQYPSTTSDAQTWFKNQSEYYRLAACRNFKDLQPEIYHISLLGKSVKMYKDASNVIYTSPKVNWVITGTDQSGYTIVTEDGTICVLNVIQSSNTEAWQELGFLYNPNSAFYMSKLKHANGKDSIMFNYVANNYAVDAKIEDVVRTEVLNFSPSGFVTFAGCSSPIAVPLGQTFTYTKNNQTFNDFVLSSITSKDMTVTFHNSFTRSDVFNANQNKHRVDSITINNHTGAFVKRILFNYDYFGGSSGWLKLNGIDERGPNSKKNLLNFDYYLPNTFPAKDLYGIDHWGYWTNRSSSTLIPEVKVSSTYNIPGANREPVFETTLAAALKSVIYPTKGSINFSYELNEYDITNQDTSFSYYDFTSVTKNCSVNALRITDSNTISIDYPQKVELRGNLVAKPNAMEPEIVFVELYFGTTLIHTMTLTPSITTRSDLVDITTSGVYTLKVTADQLGFAGSGHVTALNRTLITNSMILPAKIGGLRIKHIKYIDAAQITKQIKFKYELPNNTLSSGIRIYKPTYSSNSFSPIYKVACGGGSLISNPNQLVGVWNFINTSSTSYAPMSTANKYHVFYSSIWIEDSLAGKQNNIYSYYADEGKFYKFPYPPPTSNEEIRGKLMNQKIWDKNGQLVKESINSYYTSPLHWLIGMKCGSNKGDLEMFDANFNVLLGYAYKINQFWPYMQQSTEKSYSQSNQALEKITNMEHDNVTLNVTKQSYTQSDGKVRTIEFKYPNDFSASGNVYEKMVNRHMINQVIATNEYIDNVLIYTKRTNYFEPYANLIVPQSEETFKAGGVLESRITYDNYDATTGRLTQLKQTNGTPVALLWSAQNNNLIAKVSNASPAEVFYENFEAPINTNSQFHTGEKSLAGDYTCPFIKPNAKTYMVDYWYFDGVNWIYIKKNYTNNMILSEGNNIDNVRIYPQDAQMISYTYKTGTGITSEEAPNGIVAKYEYDDFYRLIRIRDQYNNILKTMDYNYKP
jgi:YD repeat-containing protein